MMLPLDQIVSTHQSKILSVEQARQTTPMIAMQAYYSFAAQQLMQAFEHVDQASDLLFALGKLHSVMAAENVGQQPANRAVALVMHQAALSVNPRNFMSANELGVALADLGYLDAAKAALLQSVSTNPTPQAWRNLAAVHMRLGEDKLAQLANNEAALVTAPGETSESLIASQIRWVSPQEFAAHQTSGFEFNEPPAQDANSTTSNPAFSYPRESGQEQSKSSFWPSLKKWFH